MKSLSSKPQQWDRWWKTHALGQESEQMPDEPSSPGGSVGCRYCHGATLGTTEDGFCACTNPQCGVFYGYVLDLRAEWRYYGSSDDHHAQDPTRCGMPINPLLYESSHGCRMQYSGRMTPEMRRIRRYVEWQSMPHGEKTRYDDFQHIITCGQNAGIPKLILDNATYYHKKLGESEKHFRSSNREALLAASLYLACRLHNFPRSPKEIAEIFHLDIASTTKGCKTAQHLLQDMEVDGDITLNHTTSKSFIDRFCSKLQINDELTKLCMFLSVKVEQTECMGENAPPSIAAGIVYLVAQLCQLPLSKQDVRAVSGTSEVTINKCFRKLQTIVQREQWIPATIRRKYAVP